MDKLLLKYERAECLIKEIKLQIKLLHDNGLDCVSYEEEYKKLAEENKELNAKISEAQKSVIKAEISNGIKQIPLPNNKKEQTLEASGDKAAPTLSVAPKKSEKKEKPKQAAKETTDSNKSKAAASTEVIDASRLNMKIGKIVEIKKHEEADSLYVEKVDVGESKPRQIISGLVKFCKEEDLLGKKAVFLLNLKPAKMRGVMSEGMIMCASAPEQGIVQPLLVPDDAQPGDRVTVEGYDGEPDDIMNPKKKIFEAIKPDLRVNSDGVATYKGAKWVWKGQAGVINSSKLKDVAIA